MPRPDAIDYVVSAVLLIVLLIVAPVLTGRALTPHVDGEPMVLNATILEEQRYIARTNEVLALCVDVHTQLEDLPPAEQALVASAALQKSVDATDEAWNELDEMEPPGRFVALHEQTLSLVKLYRYLVGEAWAYYGDMDDTHLVDVQQGLTEADEERTRLENLVRALDFESAPARAPRDRNVRRPSPTPTPGLILPEWGSR